VTAGGLAEAKTEAERAALIEAGRLLFARPCRFVHAAQRLEELPPPEGLEVAFCGRSNVGKSSLLNALTGRRGLARVSATPGRTQQLTFFDLDGRLVLVDMPGYGYARAAKKVKEDWQGLLFDYLRGRPNLRRVLLLMDARVETKPADLAALELLGRAAVSTQIVVTKADAVKPAALAARLAGLAELARGRTAVHPLILPTSATTGAGMAELRAELAALAG
jgi:GTP-binding protein